MMKRKRILWLLILTTLLGLTACGSKTPTHNENAPGRMIRQIDVAIHPEDDRFSRTYVTQQNMSELLTLLRTMATKKYPEKAPDLNSGQTYYTITVTYANGERNVYYLLAHTYLRLGNDPWCLVDRDLSLRFLDFLRTHPSDDGSVPIETTAPTE